MQASEEVQAFGAAVPLTHDRKASQASNLLLNAKQVCSSTFEP